MKKTAFVSILMLSLYSSVAFCQLTVQKVVQERITTMLLEDNVILKKPKDKKEDENNKKLKDALPRTYPMPRYKLNSQLDASLNVSGINLAEMGSIFFTGDINLATFRRKADVAIQDNLKQVGLINPNRANYELSINSSYVMATAAEANLGSDNPYFNLQAVAALKKSKSTHRQLSFAVGTFENSLANLFERVNQNKFIEHDDWLPIYDLWTLYSTNKVKPDANILKDFEGLSIYENNSANWESGANFDSKLKAKYSIPLIKLQAEGNFKWEKSEQVDFKETFFDLYLFGQPNTTNVPKPGNIANCWDLYEGERESPVFAEGYLTPNQPAKVIVQFGPVPEQYVNDITLDFDYLKNSLMAKNLIKGGQNDIKFRSGGADSKIQGMWNYEIQLSLNPEFLAQYNGSEEKYSDKMDIRLFFKQPVAINNQVKYLDCLYEDIEIKVSTLPTIYSKNPEYKVTSTSLTDYKWLLEYKLKQRDATHKIQGVHLQDVSFQNEKFNYLKEQIVKGELKKNGDDEFQYNLELKFQPNTLDVNEIMYLEFSFKIVENNSDYFRKAKVKIVAPTNKVSTPIEVSITNIESLKSALNQDFIFENGKKLKAILEENIANEDLILLLTNELNLKFEQDKGYIIKTKYLNEKALQSMLNK